MERSPKVTINGLVIYVVKLFSVEAILKGTPEQYIRSQRRNENLQSNNFQEKNICDILIFDQYFTDHNNMYGSDKSNIVNPEDNCS